MQTLYSTDLVKLAISANWECGQTRVRQGLPKMGGCPLGTQMFWEGYAPLQIFARRILKGHPTYHAHFCGVAQKLF